MTRRDYLEMIPAAASKGAALGFLASHLGVPLAEVIAVGDQENDIEIVRAAGRTAPPEEQGGLLALFTDILAEYFE